MVAEMESEPNKLNSTVFVPSRFFTYITDKEFLFVTADVYMCWNWLF